MYLQKSTTFNNLPTTIISCVALTLSPLPFPSVIIQVWLPVRPEVRYGTTISEFVEFIKGQASQVEDHSKVTVPFGSTGEHVTVTGPAAAKNRFSPTEASGGSISMVILMPSPVSYNRKIH